MIAFIYALIYFNAGADNCPTSFDFTGITEIGNEEYRNCENSIGKNLVLSGITKIGQFSFYKCIGITGKLTINSDADALHIEQSAFQGCTGITELAFNDKVRYIDSNAFNGCSGIVSMKLPTYLIEIGNGAFYQCSEISCPIEIPFQVSKVGDFAFFNCSKITSLRKDYSSEFGKYSFSYCSSITKCEIGAIKLNDGAFSYCTNLCKFDNFNNCEIKGIGVFEGCINFTGTIQIPSEWETVPEYTFAFCDGIEGLTLHANLNSIKEKAFYYCTKLSGKLEFLYEGSSVGIEAFCGCIELTQIRNFNKISNFGNGAFKKCTQLRINGPMNFNDNIQSIPSYLFYQCSSLDSDLTITNTIKNIGSFAFYECSKLTLNSDLDLSGLNHIEKYSFYGCNDLDGKLILSNTISEIEEYSFYNCSKLTSPKTIEG